MKKSQTIAFDYKDETADVKLSFSLTTDAEKKAFLLILAEATKDVQASITEK